MLQLGCRLDLQHQFILEGRFFKGQAAQRRRILLSIESLPRSDRCSDNFDTMENRLESKVVAITGASSGIGEATALLLAERGAKVVLGARGADRLQALAERIAASGGKAAFAPTDVKRREDLSNLVGLAIERFGKLDVLVNNAGVAPNSLLDELRVEDWEEMIDVNLKGVLYGIAAALPVFRKQGFGHFVNVISTAGIQIRPTMAVYAGTKNAVKHHHRGFAPGSRQ